MRNKLLSGIASAMLFLSMAPSSSFAENTTAATTHVNPPYEEINKLLTEAAIDHDIPPEIAKALASKESDWRQFDANGQPFRNTTNDGGIGIMQVTNDSRFNQEKLATDIQYNINAGLQKLDEKFKGVDGRLPALNNNDRDILESWYFALLAYNGQVPKNSPIFRDTGAPNRGSYQELVFKELENKNTGIGVYPIPFDFKTSDFTYTENPFLLRFNVMNYRIPNSLLHTTKHSFQTNDIVLTATGARFRLGPTTQTAEVKKLPSGTKAAVTILGNFVYDETYKHTRSISMLDRQFVWYKSKLQDGTVGFTASSELEKIGERISGPTRFETAVAISQQGWEAGSDTVVLARGYDFPDALAGTPLAYQLDAPMLLTHETYLTPETKTEISRLKAKKIILLGSASAINPAIESELRAMGLTVERIGGIDRFDTAAKIAQRLPNKGKTAILAYGFNFPDALTIAPYAAKMGYPIYLSRTEELPAVSKNALKNYDRTIIVGSKGAISEAVKGQVKNPVRYGGSTRFETNLKIVNALFDGKNGQAYIATGYNFADALTGAVLAAKNNAPLLLTNATQIPDPIQSAIMTKKLHSYYLLGGSKAVGVENQLGELFQGIEY